MPRSRISRDAELAEFEHLIEVPDPDLYAALTGNVPLAPEYANALFDRIKAFRVGGSRRMKARRHDRPPNCSRPAAR